MNKMLNKKFFVSIIFLMVAIFSATMLSQTIFALAKDDKTDFSNEIVASTPVDGDCINIINDSIYRLHNLKSLDAESINELFSYNINHDSFMTKINTAGTPDVDLAELYRNTDDFAPINNVLKWQSNLENVSSYKVRVAFDNKFTKCCLIENNADINNGVTIKNPYSNTTYYWQVIATKTNGDKVYSNIFSFKTSNTIRTILVDGVSNTRDLGGGETQFGTIKQGLVYRSARLESISSDGLNTMKNELGIKTDLDLRGESEANNIINRPNPANFENYYCIATPTYASNIVDGEWDAHEEEGLGYMNYTIMFPNIKSIFKVFADVNNYPIDFHCAVGRDRTGTVGMTFKALLGYSENEILTEYFTSMFATTGAWTKSTTQLNYDGLVMPVLNYLNHFPGETLADKTAYYLINKIGMTSQEVQTIRDIMTGKIEVNNDAVNTTSDTNNYSEYAFVTFYQFGNKAVTKLINKGTVVDAPALTGELAWLNNGQSFNFANVINEDMYFVATAPIKYAVKIHKTGCGSDEDLIETYYQGDSIDFNKFAKDGYTFKVLDSYGSILKSLTVKENCTINVFYQKVR